MTLETAPKHLFPKSCRLLKSSDYQNLRLNGRRWTCLPILIGYRQGGCPSPRLGITVSKKFGKAHERNRFKRVVREAFRKLRGNFPVGLELNVLPNPQYQLSGALTEGIIAGELSRFALYCQEKFSSKAQLSR